MRWVSGVAILAAAIAAGAVAVKADDPFTPKYPLTEQLGLYERMQKGQAGANCDWFYVANDFRLRDLKQAPAEVLYDDEHHHLMAHADNNLWRTEQKKHVVDGGQSHVWQSLKQLGVTLADGSEVQTAHAAVPAAGTNGTGAGPAANGTPAPASGAAPRYQVVEFDQWDGRCTTELIILRDGVPVFAARNTAKDCRKNAQAIVGLMDVLG